MKQKNLKEDHIMIKYFAQPFDVSYRTRKSIDKKIESIEDRIEFEKYKLENETIDGELFTKEEREERLRQLELELEYYQKVLDLKYDETYLDGIFGGQMIMLASWVLGTVIGLGIGKLKK